MYIAIDIGGTKTLVALYNETGDKLNSAKFPTPDEYNQFLDELKQSTTALIEGRKIKAIACGIPGLLNEAQDTVVAFGNLPWKNLALKHDLEDYFKLPVFLENDAKMATLSEAALLKDSFTKVLYVTISTGIGAGYVVEGVLSNDLKNCEPGHMFLYHNGEMKEWEDFASGKAIKERTGKLASEIEDEETWKENVENMAIGFSPLISIIQPEVIVIGGGVGTHFNKYGDLLKSKLSEFTHPIVNIPDIREAGNPEEAVINGCYELARQKA